MWTLAPACLERTAQTALTIHCARKIRAKPPNIAATQSRAPVTTWDLVTTIARATLVGLVMGAIASILTNVLVLPARMGLRASNLLVVVAVF
eukprot:COSAG06_NODE_58717_length_276_cov_0.706215_1_plen_91_part_11